MRTKGRKNKTYEEQILDIQTLNGYQILKEMARDYKVLSLSEYQKKWKNNLKYLDK